MEVATLEKIHLRGGNQDPGKVREGGDWPWMTLCVVKNVNYVNYVNVILILLINYIIICPPVLSVL